MAGTSRSAPAPPVPYCTGQVPSPALRLFCFPFAGTGGSAFRGWRLAAELAAEVWAVRPPGRESRWREPPALEPLLGRPFAFFGHSMGALVAAELTRRLLDNGGPAPVQLFLSGCRAPGRPPKREPMSGLSDEELLARLLEMADDSPTAVRDPDLLRASFPALRADLECCERHPFQPADPIPVPVTCLAALHDSEVDVPDVAAWLWHTTRPGRLVTFPGGHLYLRDHAPQLLTEMGYDLATAPMTGGR
jgi:medium-chain acyl-[acyl-carrier-protein] hydrolase